MQEVVGSIPIGSTIFYAKAKMKKIGRYALYFILLVASAGVCFRHELNDLIENPHPQSALSVRYATPDEGKSGSKFERRVVDIMNALDEIALTPEPKPMRDLPRIFPDKPAETEIDMLTRLAQDGDSKAQAALAYRYRKGVGVPQDEAKAVEWNIKAAMQGDVYAQRDLGFAFYFGRGVPKDKFKAVKFFELAASQGDGSSQANLASFYFNGEGTPIDYQKAFEFASKTAMMNIPVGQYILALTYYYGKGAKRDFVEAYYWAKLSALNGNHVALNNLHRFSVKLQPAVQSAADARVQQWLVKNPTASE